MVKLVCALVGVKGNAFPVAIDASELVGDLKRAIKKENEKTITCDPRELELFVARKGDNTWLDRSGAEALTLDENGHPEGFAHMDELNWIVDYYGEEFQPKRGEIHVLVVVPPQQQSLPRLWLVNGSVENALNMKGVRCRLYRLAGSYLGYYDPDHLIGNQIQALWYDGATLRVHVLFKEGMYLIALESFCRFDVLLLMKRERLCYSRMHYRTNE
jgi:Crinkler effector protein N-terminal domain